MKLESWSQNSGTRILVSDYWSWNSGIRMLILNSDLFIVSTIPSLSQIDPAGEAKVKCIHCGRERKQSMARNGKFCSQRCILHWLTDHPEKTLEDAINNATHSSCKYRYPILINARHCSLYVVSG